MLQKQNLVRKASRSKERVQRVEGMEICCSRSHSYIVFCKDTLLGCREAEEFKTSVPFVARLGVSILNIELHHGLPLQETFIEANVENQTQRFSELVSKASAVRYPWRQD